MTSESRLDTLVGQILDLIRKAQDSATASAYLEKLEELSKYAEKAFSIILPNLKNDEDFYKYFQNEPENVQRSIARALKLWWANQPQKVISSIFFLLQKDEKNILRLLQEDKVQSWPNELSEDIKQRITSIESICTALHQVLQARQDSMDLANGLESLADAFHNAAVTFTYADEAQALYGCMAQLARHPLRPIEFPESQLPYFQELVRILKHRFTLEKAPVWEDLDKLQSLEQEEGISEFDLSILRTLSELRKKAAGEKKELWLARNQKGYDQVILSLAPDLSLAQVADEAETRFPFLIENRGSEWIWGIQLALEEAGITSCLEIVGEKQVSIPRLGPGEAVTRAFTIRVKKKGNAQGTLQYNCAFGRETLSSPEFQMLRGDEKLRLPSQRKRIRNPYHPDRPLRYPQDFKNFDNLSSTQTVNRLGKILSDNQGALINFYGLRRTGKTSVLYRLEQKLNKNKYFPVQIDCFDLRVIQEKWTEERFLYFIAKRIRYVVQDRLEDEAEIPVWPAEVADAKEAFKTFIKRIYKILGEDKKLVLMLDNADLLGESPFDTFALQALYDLYMMTYSEIESSFFLIVVTERAIGEEVWASYANQKPSSEKVASPDKEDKLSPYVERLELLALDQRDLTHLVALVPELQYSGLALEYLWRVTGGYPSLLQAICYYIVRDRLEAKKSNVTLPVVQRVAQWLIYNHDVQSYYNYLKLGFTGAEWDFLVALTFEKNVTFDPATMRFEVKQWDEILKSLASKQVIEQLPRGTEAKWWKLRVGFFKLWIETSPRTPNDQQPMAS